MSLAHKDNRRSLYEWEYPVTKVIHTHEGCIVGNHYHKKRTEVFVLLAGSGTALMDGEFFRIQPFNDMIALPGKAHSFSLDANSILLELSNQPYDPSDDYKT